MVKYRKIRRLSVRYRTCMFWFDTLFSQTTSLGIKVAMYVYLYVLVVVRMSTQYLCAK